MKQFIKDNTELSEYVGLIPESVYNETKRPSGKIRIWLSYDIDEGHWDDYGDGLYEWLDSLNAEAWGNSVATFIGKISYEPTNELVARWIVERMLAREKPLLHGKDYKSMEWKKTPHLSLYVYYRYDYISEDKKKHSCDSNHFVLLHNAKMPHLGGFTHQKQEKYQQLKEKRKK